MNNKQFSRKHFYLWFLKCIGFGSIALFPALGLSQTTQTAPEKTCRIMPCNTLDNLHCEMFTEPGGCPEIGWQGIICLDLMRCDLEGNSCMMTQDPALASCIDCFKTCQKKKTNCALECEGKYSRSSIRYNREKPPRGILAEMDIGHETNAKLLLEKKKEKALNPKSANDFLEKAKYLAILKALGKTCEEDAYSSSILDSLEKAIQMDPSLKKAIIEPNRDDPFSYFAEVGGTVRFQVIKGRRLDRKEDIETILQETSWHGNSRGIYNQLDEIIFLPDGQFVLNHGDIVDDKPKTVKVIKGKYMIKGTRIQLQLKEPYQGKKQFNGTIIQKNEGIVFDDPLGVFSDFVTECEA